MSLDLTPKLAGAVGSTPVTNKAVLDDGNPATVADHVLSYEFASTGGLAEQATTCDQSGRHVTTTLDDGTTISYRRVAIGNVGHRRFSEQDSVR